MEFEISLFDKKYKVTRKGEKLFIDGNPISDKVSNGDSESFLIIQEEKVHDIQLLEQKGHNLILSVNGKVCELNIKSQMDLLLEEMGMDQVNNHEQLDLVAPMPGTIIAINTKEGDDITSGQSIIVLEAMKMENSLKSPADKKVKSIHVEVGDKVAKGQLLISFE